MTQEEQYQKTIIELHNRVNILEKEKKKGFTPETLKDNGYKRFLCAWALLEELGKRTKCEKCGCTTKPKSYPSGYLYMVCVKCETVVDIKRKKKIFSAYGSIK